MNKGIIVEKNEPVERKRESYLMLPEDWISNASSTSTPVPGVPTISPLLQKQITNQPTKQTNFIHSIAQTFPSSSSSSVQSSFLTSLLLRETTLLIPDGSRDSRRVWIRTGDTLRCSGRAKAQCYLVRQFPLLLHLPLLLEDSIHVLSPANSQVTAFSRPEHCRRRPLPRFSASQVSKRLHSHTNELKTLTTKSPDDHRLVAGIVRWN